MTAASALPRALPPTSQQPFGMTEKLRQTCGGQTTSGCRGSPHCASPTSLLTNMPPKPSSAAALSLSTGKCFSASHLAAKGRSSFLANSSATTWMFAGSSGNEVLHDLSTLHTPYHLKLLLIARQTKCHTVMPAVDREACGVF